MKANQNRAGSRPRMEETPGTRPLGNVRSPSEVLAILRPSQEEPRPLRIGGLWKTGREPQDSES